MTRCTLLLVLVCAQLTELKERCARLERQCRAKHEASERSKVLNSFNDKYNSVSVSQQCGVAAAVCNGKRFRLPINSCIPRPPTLPFAFA